MARFGPLAQGGASRAFVERKRLIADEQATTPPVPSPGASTELLLYQTEDGQTRIEVRLVGETPWSTQNQMADLSQVDNSTISRHLGRILETGELPRDAAVAEFAAAAAEGTVKKSLTVRQEGGRQVSRRASLSGWSSSGQLVRNTYKFKRRATASSAGTLGATMAECCWSLRLARFLA